jgi:hypothetical protein
MARDYETLYYEQQASFTESNGMLTSERNHAIRERDEWKEAAAQANAAIEHYQAERDKSAAYAESIETLLRSILADLEEGSTDPTWPEQIRAALAKNPTEFSTHPASGNAGEKSMPAETVRYDPAPEREGVIAARERLEPEGGQEGAGPVAHPTMPGAQNDVTGRRDGQSFLGVFQAPNGWKLVPVEPTEAMLDAGRYAVFVDLKRKDGMKFMRKGYHAMLAVTPAFPAMGACAPEGLLGRARDALNGMIGLVQLVSGKRYPDFPVDNHRVIEAQSCVNAIEAAQRTTNYDAARLDWLESQWVTVATPLRYGSTLRFKACPWQDDAEETRRSLLRANIDAAMAEDAAKHPLPMGSGRALNSCGCTCDDALGESCNKCHPLGSEGGDRA